MEYVSKRNDRHEVEYGVLNLAPFAQKLLCLVFGTEGCVFGSGTAVVSWASCDVITAGELIGGVLGRLGMGLDHLLQPARP
jgi:hypothetical protein